MSRLTRIAIVLAMAAAPLRAEVSVDRPAPGVVLPYFQPTPMGPWTQVRAGVAPADLLNPNGDAVGDGWPFIVRNLGSHLPEVCWSAAGADPEIVFSNHDGTAWSAPYNISRAAGADTLPAMTTDGYGNRFFAWNHWRSSRNAVWFTAVPGNDASQETSTVELSARRNAARRASLRVYSDLMVYVAYEEQATSNNALIQIAIDQVNVPRAPTGLVLCGGEASPVVARMRTIATSMSDPQFVALPLVHYIEGHFWVDWDDNPTRVGWSELVDGVFTDPQYIDLGPGETLADGREDVRHRVLGH